MALVHIIKGLRLFTRIAIIFSLVPILFLTDALAISLYKWVDAEGNVSYQDSPPPSGQTFEEKTFTGQAAVPGKASNSSSQLPVLFYVSSDCNDCGTVRVILEMNKVPYKQILIDFNEQAQQQLLATSGSNKVPTVVIGDQVIEQLDRRYLENALRAGGHPRPRLIEE